MKRFLEAGRLGAPRGVKGEIKLNCYCDSPEFLDGLKVLYLDANGSKPLEIAAYRPTVPCLLFKGYEDRGLASSLTNRTVWFDRNDITLPEGVCYNDDLLGLSVYGTDGLLIGTLTDIEEGVRTDFYIISCPDGVKYRVPVVEEYIHTTSLSEGIVVSSLEGLEA